MTPDEIRDTYELLKAAGRTHVPVPISEWREFMATKPVKGKVKTAGGKTTFEPAKPRIPPVLAAGKKHKADRVEKGLKANREAKRK